MAIVYQVYLNNNNLRFSDAVRITNFTASAYTPYPRVIDIDRDGTPEVFYSLNWGHFSLLYKNSDDKYDLYKLTLEKSGDLNVRSRFGEHQAPEIADADGDGVMDLITSGDSGDIVFFRGVDNVLQAQTKIEKMMTKHPNDLVIQAEASDDVYQEYYENHRALQKFVNSPWVKETEKKSVYLWYIDQNF